MAISSINTASEYTSVGMAVIWTLQKGSVVTGETVAPIGTLDPGATIKFSASKNIKGLLYGKISNNPKGFKSNGSPIITASGSYIAAAQLTLKLPGNSTIAAGTPVTGGVVEIKGITTINPPIKLKVKSGYHWDMYTGPSVTKFKRLPDKAFASNTSVQIYATVQGMDGNTNVTWASPTAALNMWGIYKQTGGKLYDALITEAESNHNTTVSNASNLLTNANLSNNGVVIDSAEDTMINMDSVMSQLDRLSGRMTFGESQSLQSLHNMQYVIGIPPKITKTADPRYMENLSPANGFGRAYTEMFMMNNCVFSIQPCKVRYLPGFAKDQKEGFLNLVNSSVKNAMDDAEIAGTGAEMGLSGQLFEGQPDYSTYINTVNMLARTTAIYLGLGDKKYMGTGPRYSNMDYSFYKMRNSSGDSGEKDIFGVIGDGARAVANALVTSAINDDTYIHFYMTADGTGVNDSMTVSTRSSGMESLFNNGLSEMAQDLQFLFGGNSTVKGIEDAVIGAADSLAGIAPGDLGTTLKSIVGYGANYLNGGRLVFPQMLNDCNYDRSYRGTCRFISPSGDTEAIFLNCYLPLCYLWPYVLPQMLSDNMYKYPFLCKVDASGLFHCDLAALTDLAIQRGGSDGTNWTSDGLPFEIDVSFSITPLYSKLMVTNARHPILFLSNTALHEYLGAMCGVCFTGDQIALKLSVLKSLIGNEITDTVPSILRGYYSTTAARWLKNIFNF